MVDGATVKPSSASQTPESDSSSAESKPIVTEKLRSTGNRWTDFQLAVKRISIRDDLAHIGEIPCARNSLLSGIASGIGIGVIRGINVKPFVAANWAVGTFVVVAVGTWNVCQASIRSERDKVRVVVEKMSQRRANRVEQPQTNKS